MDIILKWLAEYGYIILFCSLFLELLAFPLPGELLMTYCGFLVYQNKLHWWASILISAMGTIIGITISYVIGRLLEKNFFFKYGHYFHLPPERLMKVSIWFDKYGNKLLIMAFYIPGLRHLTGYFSGIVQLRFRQFAKYAYIGAFIWTSTFISLGKFIGPDWNRCYNLVSKNSITIFVGIGSIVFLIYLYRSYKAKFFNL